ncbi:MAG: hypothetical protein AMJ54_04505 [Deltaproteobacteria bacterium SG8_13]|nr:MAG: hypothetical protein AMJ54_04505 [Deltaproteobacteria bacterium SG8_13]
MRLRFSLLASTLIFLMQPEAAPWAGTETVTAFVHVNLVPMTEEIVLPDHTVLVAGKRIVAIGPAGRIDVPATARVIDGSGCFLMPGLADMHIHLRENWLGGSWPVSPFFLYLANGVTTIRCFGPGGKSGRYALRWREEIDSDRRVGPRIYTCGPSLRGPVQHPELEVIRQRYRGFDFIKIYSYVTPAEFREATATAAKLGIYTAGHIPFQVGLDGALSAKMDEIAHVEELWWELVDFDRHKALSGAAWMPYVIAAAFEEYRPFLGLDESEIENRMGPLIAGIVAKLKGKAIPVCTTLFIDEVIVEKLHRPQAFLDKPVNRYLPQWYIDQFRQGKEKHQRQFKGGEEFAPFKYSIDRLILKALRENRIPLLLATDAGTGGMGLVPGFSIHDELRILVENGFSPYEALATGTTNVSPVIRDMTGQGNLGTIEVGHRADLLLVERNPLDDVAHIRKLRGVMAAGRWHEAQALREIISLGTSTDSGGLQ